MSETIVDRLVVKLGLDSKDYDTNRKKVTNDLNKTKADVDKATKDIKASGKKGAEGFDAMGKSAKGFLALIGGTYAVKRFVQDVTATNAEMYRLSQNLQLSAKTVDSFGKAAYIAGGSAEGMQATIAGISRARTEYELTGQSGMTNLMSYLGLFDKFRDKSVKETDLLIAMNEQFSKMDRTEAYNVGQMFGIDAGTMNALLKSPKEFKALLAESKPLTDQQVSALEKLDLAWRRATNSMKSYFTGIVANSAPALTKLAQWAEKNPLASAIISGATAVGGVAAAGKMILNRAKGTAATAATSVATKASGAVKLARGLGLGALTYSTEANAGERDLIKELAQKGRTNFLPGSNAATGRAPILDVIAKAESAGSYDVANYRSGNKYKAKNAGLSSMTLSQVMDMQRAKSIFAAGRYQFIPETLRNAAKQMGLTGNERFDASLQDKLAMHIMPKDAKDYLSGKSADAQKALIAISKVWRGIADPRTGLTYGDKGSWANKASVMPTEALSALSASRSGSNTEVNIASLTVTTQATDANGIAKDIHLALNDTYAMQANSGLQ